MPRPPLSALGPLAARLRSSLAEGPLLRGLIVATLAGLLGAELVSGEGAALALRAGGLALVTVISVLVAALVPAPAALLRVGPRGPAAG